MKRNDRLDVPCTIEWNEKKQTRKHFLKYLIEKNNFKVMAEVGVRRGGTTFFLLDCLPNLTVYAIDTDIRQFYNDEIKEKYAQRLIPMNMTSEAAADQIPDNSLDLVFIDANHSYEYVRTDILKYSTKLKSHGLLTGHDIDYPGVNKAVKELIPTYDVGPNNVWIKKNL
jgi:predicted O-methyltransferase YrrM